MSSLARPCSALRHSFAPVWRKPIDATAIIADRSIRLDEVLTDKVIEDFDRNLDVAPLGVLKGHHSLLEVSTPRSAKLVEDVTAWLIEVQQYVSRSNVHDTESPSLFPCQRGPGMALSIKRSRLPSGTALLDPKVVLVCRKRENGLLDRFLSR